MKSLRSTGRLHASRAACEVRVAALEKIRVGQHRQARRAVALRSCARSRPDRNRSRITPLLGLAFLISAITAGRPASIFVVERGCEAARRRLRRAARAESSASETRRAAVADFLGLARENAF